MANFVPISAEDFEQASVPSLDTVGGMMSQAAKESAADFMAEPKPKYNAMEIEPSPIMRGLAGMGGAMYEPLARTAEKFELMFPGASPEAKQATIERIGRERADRAEVRSSLEDTTAGQVGSFIGAAAPSAFAGPSALGQAGMAAALGFLGGGPEKPTGLGQEMGQSATEGALEGAITGGITKGLQGGAKLVRGAAGSYTPEGKPAMELNAATKRLGIPAPTIGQLDPLAPQVLRAEPKLSMQQAQALEQRMAGTREVPTVGGGVETQVVPGARLQEELKHAIDVHKQQAHGMYADVDNFVNENNLSKVKPSYSTNILSEINKKLTATGKEPTGNNLAFNLLDSYDPDAFNWLKRAGSPKAAKESGMSMTEYHASRVATGRALSALDRVPPANRTADQIEAQKLLLDLKKALDSDVESWAKSNAGNKEAMELYNRAKDFYAKTTAPATNNPFAKKAASVTRGFESPERMYAAVTNPSNRSLVERLRPTMSREGLDMVNVLQNLPGMKEAVTKGAIPQATDQGMGALVAAGLGHPGNFAMKVMPGLRAISRTAPAKAAYFGAPAPGEVAGPIAQYLSNIGKNMIGF